MDPTQAGKTSEAARHYAGLTNPESYFCISYIYERFCIEIAS